ncbi:hypothetical protein M758_5G049300 [Ceratodon purpureus]|nr:hypothetical protein M758_5G049300 [Ceratodon purpureus]
METEEQKRVRAVVEDILAGADLDALTERKVRDLASEKTGIDLSQNVLWKEFVANLVMKFFQSLNYKRVEKPSGSDGAAGDERASREVERASREAERALIVREASRDGSSKKVADIKRKKDVSDEEHEDDEDERRGGGKRQKYETDDEGNHIICELSAKRKVAVSQWRGKTLVSIREYYEKDGKVMPGAKGISLTPEQFAILVKATDDIERAIASMK